MATIKITQLPSIGNGLSASTILPVVNTSGTATTDKVSVGTVANFVLTQAGNTLPPAFVANLAYSVANAAQPNITSVGTLSVNTLKISGGDNGYVLQTDGAGNLAWVAGGGSGNGEVGGSSGQIQFNDAGNFGGSPSLTWDQANALLGTVNFAASHATIYGNIDAVNVNATGNVKPNAIYTDHYYYANGYVFGGGGGNGVPGGANTQIQFNDGGLFAGNTGFTFNKTSGIFTSPFLAGNGNGLSNIQGANISGFVPNANVANTAFAVAGANVSGAVTFAGTANSVAVANVVGIGNIATVALNGNGSQYLRGNGTWGNVSAGSNTGNVTFDNNIVIGTGTQDGYLGLYLAIGPDSVANSQYLQVRGGDNLTHIHLDTGNNAYFDQYFGNDNKYVKLSAGDTGDVVIGTDDTTGNLYRWSFDSEGNLTVPGNIQSITTGFPFTSTITGITTGNPTVIVTIADSPFPGPVTGQVTITDVVGTVEANNTWYFEATENNEFQLYYDQALTSPVDGDIWTTYVSGGSAVALGFNDLSITGGSVQIFNNNGLRWTFDNNGALTIPAGDSTIINQGQIFSDNESSFINLDVQFGSNVLGGVRLGTSGPQPVDIMTGDGSGGNNIWRFDSSGGTIFPTLNVQRGDNPSGTISGQTLLFGDRNQEAIISTPDGAAGTEYSQRLVINPGQGYNYGEGGDIYLWAGRGGDGSGSGGDIKIRGGQGGANTTGGNGGDGGYIRIEAGDTATTGGYPGYVNVVGGNSATIQGGYVEILGGRGATYGGNANLKGGYGTSTGGNVNIWGGGSGNGQVNEGNVNIQTGGHTWTYDPSGILTFPDSTVMGAVEGAGTFGFYNANNTNFLIEGPNNITWSFNTGTGNITLPTISLGSGLDEQAVISSQRKLIPPLRYSAVIDGTTPTIVYTATNVDTTSMKVTMQIQHTGLGMEFFEVFATFTGADTYYTVGNRVAPPTIDASTVVVGLTGSNAMKITVTINSGAATSWVTYDATEFGIAVD
jgi:hypothetical protein